jgi:hypothetical protein
LEANLPQIFQDEVIFKRFDGEWFKDIHNINLEFIARSAIDVLNGLEKGPIQACGQYLGCKGWNLSGLGINLKINL